MPRWWRRLFRQRVQDPPPADAGNGAAAQEARLRAQERLRDAQQRQREVDRMMQQRLDALGEDLDRSFRRRAA